MKKYKKNLFQKKIKVNLKGRLILFQFFRENFI